MIAAGNNSTSTPARGKRVLMLIENGAYSEDGRVRCEANSLAAAGYTVTVIGPWSTGEGWYEKFGQVVTYQYPPPPSANGLIGYVVEYAYALTLMGLLSLWVAFRRGFDVVHAHNPPDFLVVIAGFWRLCGKQFIFDQHDLSPDMYLSRFSQPGNKTLHRVLLMFERLSCRWADHVIATNESAKRIQMERSGIPENRITVVRNGPEPWHMQRFEADNTLRGGASIVIGYVGIMGRQDGVDHLLRALQILQHEFNEADWRCILIGKGPEVSELQRQAVTLEIADKIQFTGWVDYEKVPSYLAACDICVVPDPSNEYNDRSTIVKLMEYMAQAKPVVAFDLPEHRVTAGDTALYAAPNDDRDFASHIRHLIEDAALRRELGEAGRRRVLENFTWQRQEANLLAAYRSLDIGGERENKYEVADEPELATAEG